MFKILSISKSGRISEVTYALTKKTADILLVATYKYSKLLGIA